MNPEPDEVLEDEDRESGIVQDFLAEYFDNELNSSDFSDLEVSDDEQEIIESIFEYTENRFAASKGMLGLALDFIILAQKLSDGDEDIDEFRPDMELSDFFDPYERKDTRTLTLKRDGAQFGIRPIHNDLIELFHEDLKRTTFPSSPGHHTGNWATHKPITEQTFQLSETGRFILAQRLFQFGLDNLEKKTTESREPPFPEPFLDMLEQYPRTAPFEEGGMAFQALSYGFVKSEWPHLSLRASKVRTGSERQSRYGDIDGYYGPDLMISVEVKDLDITEDNVRAELGKMAMVSENTTAKAIVIARSISEEAKEYLIDRGVAFYEESDLIRLMNYWDYHKQNRAVQGAVHYVSNVEENPPALQRMLRFVENSDPENPALAHLTGEE